LLSFEGKEKEKNTCSASQSIAVPDYVPTVHMRTHNAVGNHGLSMGLFNARSVNNKIANISDVVMDEKLDLLMISEA